MKGVQKKITAAALFLLVISLLLSPVALAAPKAKTTPPPTYVQLMTTYSGYTYLSASNRGIRDNGNESVTITATTQAKTSVTEIGAIIQLQEWTGSQWVNVGSETILYSTNTSYFSKSVTKTASEGYYYRARVYHYVKKNGTVESVLEYTDFILAS